MARIVKIDLDVLEQRVQQKRMQHMQDDEAMFAKMSPEVRAVVKEAIAIHLAGLGAVRTLAIANRAVEEAIVKE